ncbi:MAG: antirestriction protein ArdA [Albimonas sp.]|uniref:antirestriction protein ArdA n=1 Tax=Albimonas sp. TaxID=1872425 RepID=UPI0040564E1F
MTTMLYAQPYDVDAEGFHFESAEDYARKAAGLRNRHGQPVEEFEIQFIDGERIDAALAEAVGLHQGDVAAFFEKVDEWDDDQKLRAIITVGECGYSFSFATCDPDDIDLDLYEVESLRELAEQFVDEGLFGEIPERLRFYIDHDAVARDLAVDYSETAIAGRRLVYRCG